MLKGLGLSIVAVYVLVGCTVTSSTSSSSEDPGSPTFQGPTETAYCSTPISYTGTVTITGTAQYTRRNPYYINAATGGLGSASTSGTHPATIHPIRYAEVRVLSSAGAVAQCAETDSSGNFSFALPTGAGTYTIYINSRGNNSHVYASVLGKPVNNEFYSLTVTVTPNVSKSVGTLTAAANGNLLGAAFNIFDQIVNANDYLRAQAGTCPFANCTAFTVAPKVSAYWTAGFNPNSYFGSSSGLSFYLPGYSRLFILGGIDGDIDHSDTDHFDNSVIIHEYGHFLEDTLFETDSPGGSHNGNRVIDPRLAWSEGWGNFFQAAVRNEAYYTDTLGNDDGTTSIAFHVDLEDVDTHDSPTTMGEGNFREFSVTRLLWDAIDGTNSTERNGGGSLPTAGDDISGRFVEIFTALSRTSLGFRDPSYTFRNIGLLHLIQRNMQAHESAAGATDWSNIRVLNRQDGDESGYAQYVVTGSSCSAYSFTPASVSGDTGSLATSDLFRNNDFYHLRITSAGTYTLQLDYVDANASGTVADLDLYLYNKSARFAVTADMIKYSRDTPSQVASATQTEAFSVSLAAGDYLIDVNAYTGGSLGGTVNYTLKLNGSSLCPGTLVAP